jgi:CBS domain-containing protein
MTLAGFANGVFADSRHAAYPVLDGPEVLGAVSYRDVAAVAPEDWGLTRVRDVARPVGELLVLAPDDNLGDAATSLAQDDLGRALVLDQGALAGLLSMTDVARLIELRAPARSSRRDRRAIAAPVRDLPAQPDVRDHARDRR